MNEYSHGIPHRVYLFTSSALWGKQPHRRWTCKRRQNRYLEEKKNHCPPLKRSPHEKMRAVHGFLNHSYSPMNSPWKYNREGITRSSGNIQINYKQGLVCWKLCVQECLSTIQQVYSSFEAWQGSLCWGEAIPFEMWKFPVRIKMTSSWQPTDVSTQTGPSRASRRKVVKTLPRGKSGQVTWTQKSPRGSCYNGVRPLKIILIITAVANWVFIPRTEVRGFRSFSLCHPVAPHYKYHDVPIIFM